MQRLGITNDIAKPRHGVCDVGVARTDLIDGSVRVGKGTSKSGRVKELNRRSLHCATPDFLSGLVALANFMRLSLRKAAHAAMRGAA
jgi:hypothetical protein